MSAEPAEPGEKSLYDRRAFLVWAATASLSASGVFMFITLGRALTPPGRSIDGMTQVGPLPVAKLSELEVGVPVLTEYGDDMIFVVKTSAETARAYDAACPHARCSLAFNAATRRFDCPCHGSTFTLSGRKIDGPSPRDMVPAVVTIENDQVIVSGFVPIESDRIITGAGA